MHRLLKKLRFFRLSVSIGPINSPSNESFLDILDRWFDTINLEKINHKSKQTNKLTHIRDFSSRKKSKISHPSGQWFEIFTIGISDSQNFEVYFVQNDLLFTVFLPFSKIIKKKSPTCKFWLPIRRLMNLIYLEFP